MDPNETLRIIRLMAARFHDTPPNDGVYDIAAEAFEWFTALDDWISNGGFLPDDWAREQR